MNIRDLLKKDSIILNEHCESKQEALEKLVLRHLETGHLNDKDQYLNAIRTREELSSTGVGNMIAIPHAQDDSVNYPALVAMIDKEGVDFDSLDQQPAKIFFMIAVPKDGGSQHLEILAQLCQILMDEKIVNQLLKSGTAQQFIDILTSQMEDDNKEEAIMTKDIFDVVAVTACPTGIAHTYMAAKSLEDTAKEIGIQIKVETNGASGIKNRLTVDEIDQAQCVIIAADKKVELSRFHGKRMIQVPVAKGIHEAKELLQIATSGEADIFNSQESIKDQNDQKGIRKVYKHLMNGISNIIPVLMIYGILMGIVLNIPELTGWGEAGVSTKDIHNYIMTLNVVKTFSLSILAAFIADSISEKPGFIVAFVVSLYALYIQCGVIEVIIIGFAIGYFVKLLQKIFSYLPEVIDSVIPNLLLPIIGTAGGYILVEMLTQFEINNSIYIFFSGDINQVIFIIVGAILGMMMSIDMGGPINKTAYTIGIISLCTVLPNMMSAVMIAGMIPPIAIWLSMLLVPSLFTNQERKGKWRCLIKGLCFVSEEAIPYMSNDKKGIHIPCIIASAIAGALSIYFNCSQLFPHGGIFVLPLIQEPWYFLLTMAISTFVGTLLIICLRKTPKN